MSKSNGKKEEGKPYFYKLLLSIKKYAKSYITTRESLIIINSYLNTYYITNLLQLLVKEVGTCLLHQNPTANQNKEGKLYSFVMREVGIF